MRNMIHKVKGLFDKPVYFKLCNTIDLQEHFEVMKKDVPKEHQHRMYQRMQKAVDNQTAFCTIKHDCFLYYLKQDTAMAEGVAINSKNQPNELLALLIGVFDSIDTETLFIRFNLHDSKFISKYKSILTKSSLEIKTANSNLVTIRLLNLKQKLDRLIKRRNSNG